MREKSKLKKAWCKKLLIGNSFLFHKFQKYMEKGLILLSPYYRIYMLFIVGLWIA